MRAEQTLSTEVASAIKRELGGQDLNKSELARRLGVSHTWVTNRLAGHLEIGLNELQRIATALQVPITDLLPREVAGQLNRRLELAADQLTPAPGYATPTLANPPPMYQLAEHATRRPTRLTTACPRTVT
jgi:transcriptional regulator with XRE-family HTH domain